MADTVLFDCPQCGEEEQEVVRAAASGWTLRCAACRHVHAAPAPPGERTVTVPVVLADGATSRPTRIQVPLDGAVAVGDEFEAEGHRIRVTALERTDGAAATSAAGRDLRSLSAKVYDTLSLRLSLNEGERTRSFRLEVEPERRLEVGELLEVEGLQLRIASLLSDDFRTLRKGSLEAPRVRRVLCQPADRAKARKSHGKGPPPRRRGPARRA